MEDIAHVAALAAAAFAIWRVRGQISVRNGTVINDLFGHMVALGYLIGAHLLVTWAFGPWAAAAVVLVGLILATEPWRLLDDQPQQQAVVPEPQPEPEMAGGGQMTPDEQAAWDDLMRRLSD